MGKLLLLLLVVGVVLWLIGGRRRVRPPNDAAAGKPSPKAKVAPMLACVHCGVHLPQVEALMDSSGRAFCSEAHRLAGPR